jgi:hypothetical protein
MKIKKTSILLIPIFNEGKGLKELFPKLKELNSGEISFINDGSTDNSLKILKDQNYPYINILKNKGKGHAISVGVNYALNRGKNWVITMDGDLQHPPELIEKFDQCSIIEIKLGWRKNKNTMPQFRKISNIVTSLLLSIRSNTHIKDSQCGYRGFSPEIYTKCKNTENGFHMESEFLIKASLLGVPIRHIEIPTIYNDSVSSMNYFPDLMKFISLWFRSFLWT